MFPEFAHYRASSTHAPRRPVKGSEHPVADRLHAAPAMTVDLAVDDRVVLAEHELPTRVADPSSVGSRVDNVCKQNCR